MDKDALVFLICMAGAFGFGGVILVIATITGRKSCAQRIEQLSREVNGTVVEDGTILGFAKPRPVIHTEREGRKMPMWATPGRYPKVGFQWVTEPLPVAVFRRERTRDRVGRRLALNREIQTGDQAFDDLVYIETDEQPDTIKELVASPQARAEIAPWSRWRCWPSSDTSPSGLRPRSSPTRGSRISQPSRS